MVGASPLPKKEYGTLSVPSKDDALQEHDARTSELDSLMFKVCFYICGFELVERIAFYSLSGTVVFHLEDLGMSLQSASATSANMSTLAFFWTILAGWIADAWLGRFYTIVLAAILYCAGTVLTTVAAHPSVASKSLYLVGMLGVVPLATAGVKACLSVFGGDQFDNSTTLGRMYQQRFFSYFFVAVNIGATFSYAFLVNFGQSGGLGVSQDMGYFTVYLIAAIIMTIGLVIFCSGAKYLKFVPKPAAGSSVYWLVKPIFDAAKRGSYQAALIMASFFGLIVSLLLSTGNNTTLSTVSGVISIASIVILVVWARRPYWLDRGSDGQHDLNVANAKGVLRLIPLCLTAQISGLMAQAVMSVWYANQACQMDVRIGQGQLSGSFFNVVDCMGIVILTPFILNYVNPYLERLIGRSMDYADRIYLGSTVGCLSMLSAGLLELIRKSSPRLGQSATCGPDVSRMADVSAFWICIPYVLCAISEIYVMPTVLHLAYDKSPGSMRTLATMVVYFVSAVITQILSVVSRIMSSAVPDDLYNGHLEYLYLTFIFIGVCFMGVFSIVDMDFRTQSEEDDDPLTS